MSLNTTRQLQTCSQAWSTFMPGLLLAVTIAIAAQFLGEHYGAPIMLFALLIGMAFNFLAQDSRCSAGIELGSKSLLRVGVALLGLRISAGDFMALGGSSVIAVIGLLIVTILCGLLGARLLGERWQFGLLTGGAVAICGASAALALAAVLIVDKRSERDTLFTVVAVTTLSTLAMIIYPVIIEQLGLTEQQAGFILGATIHDVAQVVGAGYSMSETTGETATIIKLIRVSCLPLVLIAVLLLTGGSSERSRIQFPPFLIGFGILATLNSLGVVPEPISEFVSQLSRWLLVIAIAALGVKTSIQAMLGLGRSQISLVVAITVALFVMAIICVQWVL